MHNNLDFFYKHNYVQNVFKLMIKFIKLSCVYLIQEKSFDNYEAILLKFKMISDI
jgi:hypothetical protein